MDLDRELEITMERFAGELNRILPGNRLAAILYGSAVLGDFVPGRGDLDFLVVTARELGEDDPARLMALHDRMRGGELGRLAAQLEGTYYPLAVVQDPLRARGRGCYIGTSRQGWGEATTSRNSLFDYAVIRRHGKACCGQDLAAAIYDPRPAELREVFLADLRANVVLAERLPGLEFSLAMFQWAPRGLAALLDNEFLSKRAAARWFLARFPGSPWIGPIGHAACFRPPLTREELARVDPALPGETGRFLDAVHAMARGGEP